MIDERFSAKNFITLGKDTEESNCLANLLREEIEKELHEPILRKFLEIIKKLNDLGHDLRLYEDIKIGNYAFRDDFYDENNNYQCKLRVALDFVISTGYSNLSDFDEVLEDFGIEPDD